MIKNNDFQDKTTKTATNNDLYQMAYILRQCIEEDYDLYIKTTDIKTKSEILSRRAGNLSRLEQIYNELPDEPDLYGYYKVNVQHRHVF